MDTITDVDFNIRLESIQDIIKTWESTCLTAYGKAIVVKSLIALKYTHLLRSLHSPDASMIKTIENLIFTFLWNNKPAKFWKNIMESDIKFGGMSLHNLIDFSLCLILSWLRRLQKSNAKWTHLPRRWEVDQTLQFGKEFCERLLLFWPIPFERKMIISIKYIFENSSVTCYSVLFGMPLWYNDILRVQLDRQWYEKDALLVGDILKGKCWNVRDRLFTVFSRPQY